MTQSTESGGYGYMKMKISSITVFTFLIMNMFLSGLVIQFSSGQEQNVQTLYVGTTQTYKTIQKAIDAARNGDTIYVYNGVYTENLVIKKSIELIGENANTTIIKGVTIDPVINVTASDASITDFQIKGAIIDQNNRSSSALSLGNCFHVNVTNCHLSDCQVALRLWDSDHITILSCIITNNNAGVFPFNSSTIDIINSSITRNTFYGLSIINSSFVHVFNSEISNSNGSGIALRNSQNNSITYNMIKNNKGYGVMIYKSSKTIIGSISPTNTSTNTSKPHDDFNYSNVTKPVVIEYPSLGNQIFQNNFIGNNNQASDGYRNSWDNGKVGNYWDDYYGEDLNGDNIGDITYVFFGNQDYYPLMTPVQYTGASNITLPFVAIQAPLDGTTVNGTITISGVSSYPNGEIQEVFIKIAGDSDWKKAQGTATWSYTWNTSSYENKEYRIFARSTDGNNYSLLSEITLIVNNSVKENGSTPGFETLVVLLSIFIVVFFLRITRKKDDY